MNKIGLPEWVVKLAYKFVDVEKNSPVVDERVLEYSFAISKIAKMEPGNLLDIGCVARVNLIPAVACELGWKVWGIDIRDYNYEHPNFLFLKGDILELPLPLSSFNLVTCISTLEHLGVKGRYGITDSKLSADQETITKIKFLLKPKGRLVLTVPCGEEFKENSLGRVYPKNYLEKGLRWGFMRISESSIVGNLAMLELSK